MKVNWLLVCADTSDYDSFFTVGKYFPILQTHLSQGIGGEIELATIILPDSRLACFSIRNEKPEYRGESGRRELREVN